MEFYKVKKKFIEKENYKWLIKNKIFEEFLFLILVIKSTFLQMQKIFQEIELKE